MPTNWQDDLISHLDPQYVEDIYGKLTMDFIGGGRPAYILPSVSRKQAAEQIKLILKKGLKFNYLLNASCMGNKELTAGGQKELSKIIRWLLDLNVTSVTVTSPYLAQWLKTNYPAVRVVVSSFANVNSITRAKFWEDIGADEITLSPIELNRNFELLKAIRKNVRCKLQLIANNNCLLHCPLYAYHGNLQAHSSQSGHELKGFFIDYCRLTCNYKRMNELSNFIKGDWIRPEDILFYAKLGVDKIKLVDRPMTTNALVRIMNAYIARSYEGNLLDLFSGNSDVIVFKNFRLLHFFKYFFHPRQVNVFKLYRIRKLMRKTDVYIDNKALDGFLEGLTDKDCLHTSCRECGYCNKIAEKVVKVEQTLLKEITKSYSECLYQVNSGDIFK